MQWGSSLLAYYGQLAVITILLVSCARSTYGYVDRRLKKTSLMGKKQEYRSRITKNNRKMRGFCH